MPLLIVNSYNVKSNCIGKSEKIVMAIYYLARLMSPSIVLIDQAEELLLRRDDHCESSTLSGITSSFLTCIDNSENVLTIATTNFPWKIDEAVMQRLERQLFCNLPNTEERRQILLIELNKRKNCIQAYEISFIAEKLEGYSSREITMVVSHAQKLAYRRLSTMTFFQRSQATGKWIACRDTDKWSCSAKFSDFSKNSGSIFDGKEYDTLPIDMLDMEMAVRNVKSCIQQSTLDSFKSYLKGDC